MDADDETWTANRDWRGLVSLFRLGVVLFLRLVFTYYFLFSKMNSLKDTTLR